jgi:hypothetical protein
MACMNGTALASVEGGRPRPKASLRAWKGLVDGLHEDGLGVLRRDLFDVHAALRRGHEHRRLARAVHDHGEVHLAGARELHALLDEQAAHDAALGPGLVRAEPHAEHGLGDGLGLFGGAGQLDAAALAPPARVDLGLHDHREAQLLGHLDRFVRRVGDLAPRDRDPEAREQRLRLILVDLHRSVMPPACPGARAKPSMLVSARERVKHQAVPSRRRVGKRHAGAKRRGSPAAQMRK